MTKNDANDILNGLDALVHILDEAQRSNDAGEPQIKPHPHRELDSRQVAYKRDLPKRQANELLKKLQPRYEGSTPIIGEEIPQLIMDKFDNEKLQVSLGGCDFEHFESMDVSAYEGFHSAAQEYSIWHVTFKAKIKQVYHDQYKAKSYTYKSGIFDKYKDKGGKTESAEKMNVSCVKNASMTSTNSYFLECTILQAVATTTSSDST
ncbi:hypothetical protein BDN70DRAFT_892945 [Pholiota conissans]|uniref:Uncharacterized protein n=1 Tax=Pholiota conissans TaxID=109636 RepID=A0A9P5Z9I0_9AGAR|nr:hypothetical protein BDN70DRAFT_892945 [Pholiota conissans]